MRSHIIRRLGTVGAAALCATGLTACAGAVDSHSSHSGHDTITVWNGYSGRELGVFTSVMRDFEAKHPGVHVNVVGQQSNDKLVQGLRGSNAPDVEWASSNDLIGQFCRSGAWLDLSDRLAKDHTDSAGFTPASWQATQSDGKRCALPTLGDVYGLYYNKKLFAQAGITSPPKTFDELSAAAKKLTQYNADGSIKVAGYMPLVDFYANRVQFYAPFFGAQWFTAHGKASTATSPGWTDYANWLKSTVDGYGYAKAKAFTAAAGDPYSAANAFQQGKIAMMIDGEYRSAFIKQYTPDLDFGTAPMPVGPRAAGNYGMAYVVNHMAGVTKASRDPDLAYQLVHYLATDTAAQVKLANGLYNVPTWQPALRSPNLIKDASYQSFLKMQVDPHSATSPTSAVGEGYFTPMSNFLELWQAGKAKDAHAGFAGVDRQIDGLLAQG